ncbi:hypothetical protein U1839_20820 [Sphingomonas sp. RT2P30]
MLAIALALAGAMPAAPGIGATRVPRPRAAAMRKAAVPAAATPAPSPSAATLRVAAWIAATADNHALPYAIIDKNDAALMLFDARGKMIGAVPVLIGVAAGDAATPGTGSKNLAEIGPAEKTTPAGRFLARYGVAAGRQRVLWVDYATSVALHPIPPGASPKERRRQRLLSPTPDDNRITFGCINVPAAFYARSLAPLFRRKGGYVYVLPDSWPIERVFPGLLAMPVAAGDGG